MQNTIYQKYQIDKIVKAAKDCGSSQVILFGSNAISDKGNDLDLCLLVDKNEDTLSFQKKFRLKLWELKYNWILPLDLFVYPEDVFNKRLDQDDFFISEVAKGIKLYD